MFQSLQDELPLLQPLEEVLSPSNGLEITMPEDSFASHGHLLDNLIQWPLSMPMFNKSTATKSEDADLTTLPTLTEETADPAMDLAELALLLSQFPLT